MSLLGKFTAGVKRAFRSTVPDLEGGRMSRRLANWTPSRSHINTLIGQSGKTVLARSRYLARNNAYAAGAVECFAANLTGKGVIPSWNIDDPKKKKAIQDAFDIWTRECDVEGVTDFYGLQNRIARELFVGGECFVQLFDRPAGLSVPLQLKILPSEQLPTERNLWLESGRRVRQGIEYDASGRRVAYHFWKVHPGDVTQSGEFGQIVVIPADQIIHVHDPIESSQIRGLPRLTPALVSLWALDLYDDAELERKKTAALFSVFIKRPEGTAQTILDAQIEKQAAATDGTGVIDLQPGVAHQLLPGEDVSVSAPADVGPGYEAFQYRNLAKFCAAVGLPYSSVSGDMMKANYSNQRAAMLEMRRRMEALQGRVVIFQLCCGVARRWLETAALSGAIGLKDYVADRAAYENPTWIAPKWDWVDPLKDMTAEILAINAGIKSRDDVVEADGRDPVDNDQKIANSAKRAKDLGITFAQSNGSTGAAPSFGEDDPENADPNADEKADGVTAKIMKAFANWKPIIRVNVPVTNVMPKKGVEVTQVTAWDENGRIQSFERKEIDTPAVNGKAH